MWFASSQSAFPKEKWGIDDCSYSWNTIIPHQMCAGVDFYVFWLARLSFGNDLMLFGLSTSVFFPVYEGKLDLQQLCPQ